MPGDDFTPKPNPVPILRRSKMSKPEVVLCHPVRTAISAYGGALKNIPAPELGAAAIAGA